MTDEGLNRIILALAVAAGAFLLFPAGVLALAAPLVVWWALPRDQAPPKDTAWLGAALCALWLWWPVRDGWEAAALAHLGTQLAYLPRLPALDGALLRGLVAGHLPPRVPPGAAGGLLADRPRGGEGRGGGAREPAPVERHPAAAGDPRPRGQGGGGRGRCPWSPRGAGSVSAPSRRCPSASAPRGSRWPWRARR